MYQYEIITYEKQFLQTYLPYPILFIQDLTTAF